MQLHTALIKIRPEFAILIARLVTWPVTRHSLLDRGLPVQHALEEVTTAYAS